MKYANTDMSHCDECHPKNDEHNLAVCVCVHIDIVEICAHIESYRKGSELVDNECAVSSRLSTVRSSDTVAPGLMTVCSTRTDCVCLCARLFY